MVFLSTNRRGYLPITLSTQRTTCALITWEEPVVVDVFARVATLAVRSCARQAPFPMADEYNSDNASTRASTLSSEENTPPTMCEAADD